MKYKFFISYSGRDREQADELYSELRKQGVEVFLDHKRLRPGDSWQKELILAVQNSENLVILISKQSTEALFQQEEVLLGIELARESPERHRLCPVYLDEGAEKTSPLSLGLRGRHALYLPAEGSLSRVAERLTEKLESSSVQRRDRRALVIQLEELLKERERHIADPNPKDRNKEIDDLAQEIRAGFSVHEGAEVAGSVLDRVVGGGNFGTIWLAHRPDDQTLLATKVFDLNKLTTGVMLWRFRRSIEAIRQLNRRRDAPSSIVRIHEASDDELAFSMDYLSDGNLENVGLRGWSLERKIEVFLEVCRATEFAHRAGVIHRDIKPANVVMAADGTPVLTDFDISDIQFVTRLSVASGGLGTPVFAAPEQLEDADAATEQSDVYSLGRLLYFLLLERPPSIRIEENPELPELSRFEPGLVEVVRKATQGHPSARFSDVGEMIKALEDHKTGWAWFRARAGRAWRWARRNKWPLFFLLALLSITSGIAVYQSRVAQREENLRREIQQASILMGEWQSRFAELQEQKDSLRAEISRLESKLDVLNVKLSASGLSAEERQTMLDEKSAIQKDLDDKRELQAKLDKDLKEAQKEIETERRRLETLQQAQAERGDSRQDRPGPPEQPVKRSSHFYEGAVGKPLDIPIPEPESLNASYHVINDKLPPGMQDTGNKISGVPQRAGEYSFEVEYRSISLEPHIAPEVLLHLRIIRAKIDNGGCPEPNLALCGGHCVSLAHNPFHHFECFQIAPELRREAAEESSKPPPWLDTSGNLRRFYRTYYRWDEARKNIRVGTVSDDGTWSHGESESIDLATSIPAEALVGQEHLFVVSDFAVFCNGPVRVADYRSAERGAYEKLTTGGSWSRASTKDWSPTLPRSTESKLQTTLGEWLDYWRKVCASQDSRVQS